MEKVALFHAQFLE